MKLPVKYMVFAIIAVLALAAIVALFTGLPSESQARARNTFTEGCLKYCDDIGRSDDIIAYAIKKSEDLEGSDFMNACKFLYPDVKYNWQCWNRECCAFRVYSPL